MTWIYECVPTGSCARSLVFRVAVLKGHVRGGPTAWWLGRDWCSFHRTPVPKRAGYYRVWPLDHTGSISLCGLPLSHTHTVMPSTMLSRSQVALTRAEQKQKPCSRTSRAVSRMNLFSLLLCLVYFDTATENRLRQLLHFQYKESDGFLPDFSTGYKWSLSASLSACQQKCSEK